MNNFIRFIILVVLIVSSWGYFKSSSKTQHRNLASNEKLVSLQAKPDRMIDVKIQVLNGIPKRDDQDLTLRAIVTLKKPIVHDLEFKWMLPPGAQVVAGQEEDSWANLQVGQSVETEITVNGVSLESSSSVVVFHADTDINGVKIGGSAVFTPKPENLSLPTAHVFKENSASENPHKGVQF